MFSEIQPIKEHMDQSYAIVDCFDVRYIVYFDCCAIASEIYTYVIHRNNGGLIRRDSCPLFGKMFDLVGSYSVLYKG